MQRHLPTIVLAIAFFVLFTALPATGSAITTTRSRVSINKSSASTNTSINQSTTIKVSTTGEGTVVITSTPENPSVTSTPVAHEIATESVPTPTETQSLADRLQLSLPPKTPTSRATVTPAKAQATPTSKPTASPTNIPVSLTTDDKKTYIIKEINDYRKSLGLRTVQTSTETCNFAKIRAKEISMSFNHDGFRNRLNNGTIPYSRWSLVTENLAMTSYYQNVVDMWIASSGHAANMRKDTPYVCVENYGNYYAYEGMRP